MLSQNANIFFEPGAVLSRYIEQHIFTQGLAYRGERHRADLTYARP